MKVVQGLGVQSYCYRGFKPVADLIAKVKETGLKAVEICGVHANFNEANTFADVIGQFKAAGIAIVSLGVEGMNNKPEVEELRFQFAKQAGARHMAVNFNPATTPESFRTAEKLADKYDLRLAIHNHGGKHWLGNSQMLENVFSKTSERIGLCIDTAWCLHSHEDPIQWIEKFGKRLYGVHIKDFTFDRAGKHEDVVVGTGNLDLKKLGEALNAVNFNGYAVLEYEGDVNNPVPKLQDCVAQVRKAIPAMF